MAYNAFISYSHSADSALADALQSALHRFAKPWYKLRATHIFRDQTNLAVNPALWSSIRDAIDQSSFFIMLASPEASASPWVAKEAEYWIGKNGPSHMLIVLTGGTLKWDHSAASFTPEHTNALPEGLLRSFPEEPLFLDLRWARDIGARVRLREPRFHEAVLQLASTLHNRPKDELDGVDIRTRRHARWLAASGLIVILLTALFAAHQARLSDKESLQNLAAGLAVNSAKVLEDNPDRVREAAFLAIESNRLHPSFEANQALRAAVSLLPAGTQFYPPDNPGPGGRVRDLAFSPDGAILALAREDGSTQLLDVVKRKPVGYFNPDEKPAATIEIPGSAQNAPTVYNTAVSVAFNAAGSMVATGNRDGSAHIFDFPGGSELLSISHGAPVSQIAFHPAANRLVTASDDGHVRIFDTDRVSIAADFKCSGKISSAAFSPDGNVLAALSSDGIVSLFDSKRRTLMRTLGGFEAGFNLAFSGDGKRLAVAGGDFAFVWDITNGRQLLKASHAASSKPLTPQQWILDVAIDSRGRSLAYVWDIDAGRQTLELKHDSAVAAVVFNADGTKLGTGSYDGTARVWELPSGHEIERTAHDGGAGAVAFSPNGNRFAAGGMDGSVSVSEIRRADRPASFNLPGRVRSVAFSPDGRRVAIGTVSVHHSPLVRIAGIGGDILRDIEFHGAPVIDRLFFPDPNHVIAQWGGRLFFIVIDQSSVTVLPEVPGEKRPDPSGKVLIVQQDGVNRLYTLPGLRQIASLDSPPSARLRSAGDGRLLAFEVNKPPKEFFIEIWNIAAKTRVARILLPAELTRLAFNLSGTVLFTAQSEDLQAWDITSSKRLFSLTASGDINLILPNPSSASFATITQGRLTVWDALTGFRLAQLPDTGYIHAAAFSPDGRYLLTGYGEGSAALWLWRSGDLRDQACARLTSNLSRDEWAHLFPKRPYRQTCPNLPTAK